MNGIDPRYVINRISSAIIRKEVASINALDVLRSLKEGLDQHPSISKEDKRKYLNYISLPEKSMMKLRKRKFKKHLYIRMKNRQRH